MGISDLFSSFRNSMQKVQDSVSLIKEMDAQTEEKIAEIQQDSELCKKHINEHSARQQESMNFMMEKLKMGLENKDSEFVQNQIDDMLAMLNNKPDIEQEIADQKLKSAKPSIDS